MARFVPFPLGSPGAAQAAPFAGAAGVALKAISKVGGRGQTIKQRVEQPSAAPLPLSFHADRGIQAGT